ncbi:MAG: nucleotidyltransferase family protein [Bacteroidales bacterium]|nr:nucleotidyltransferase family protein [Bacteroidales bacterium]
MSLLRAGLWERDLRLSAAPDTDGWERLLELGRGQAVMGLLLRAMAHLPAEQRPPEALQPVLRAWEEAFSRANARYSRVQGGLLAQLTAAGLHPVVQKGSAAAKYYADPSVRQVGDIDLFLPEGEFRRARALFPDARKASDGAAVFSRDGVTVELHPRYYDVHLSPAKLPPVGSPCGEILLLSSHIFKHAMGPGLGCKQLCDLTMALTRLDGKYDKNELREALKRAGLLRWHTLLCSLLTADFGLDASCCLPGFRAVDPARLRRIVRASGNFGRSDGKYRDSRERGTLGKKAATAGAFLRRLPFSLSFGARETLATMWGLALGNLK